MWIAISNAIGQRVGTGGGPGPGPGYTPPLDTYTGAAFAFSVRKLRTDYTGDCMQVYRVDDGATQEIGFDGNGLLDTAAIETFGGTSVVKISIWYDQSGNGNNGTNTSVNRYPRIYDGTDIEKDEWGNPYAVAFNANETVSNPAFAGADVRITSTAIASPYWAGEKGQSDSALSSLAWGLPGGEVRVQVQGVNFFFTDGGAPLTDPVILGGFIDGANSQVSVQAETEIQTVSSIPNQTILFGRGDGTRSLDRIYEFMNWTTAQTSSNDVGLRTNMNSYFKLTNLVPTGGFLSTYPGASAAYSVRRLSDEAQICMRVRRTVAPFDERNIGFDSNGDLDTAAIAAFGGSDPLTVSAWYDQSGQSNHATQAGATLQPSIYDGTSIISRSGIPAVQNGTNVGYMSFSSISIPASGGYTTFAAKGAQSGWGGIISGGWYPRSGGQGWIVSGSTTIANFFTSGLFDEMVMTSRKDVNDYDMWRNTTSLYSNTLGTAYAGGPFVDLFRGEPGDPNSVVDDGLLHEAIFYDSALADATVTNIQNNLITHYSL